MPAMRETAASAPTINAAQRLVAKQAYPDHLLMSANCRVEMWRGGCRLNIAVAASFVWRCLSGSAMAPFPHPAHRDVREVLSVHTRCALVGAALGVSMSQDVLAADLVVQGVETIAGFCLRFRVQRLLQFLNTLRS